VANKKVGPTHDAREGSALEGAAKAIGSAIGTIAVKTGLAHGDKTPSTKAGKLPKKDKKRRPRKEKKKAMKRAGEKRTKK